ncbi:lipid-binding SYLF domain-containing protein [Paludibaculum fermentans]|uniref:Lipid-binding SYLF domain-containing protein n=1 Tax=Paludibaculum fermentans TaxID=1473598 RepID=A0A7S7SKY7_PALFE|nr:lipid-binding SYLF domain-containing protein [Paludibaculum fermentans]QOY89677.1 lipid-binding SYLF domain-containing protein [Paludibaculum fermentans]
MKQILGITLLAALPLMAKEPPAVQRLDESAVVLSEIMGTPDKGIPQDLMEKAHCVVVVPGLKKGAFIVGGKYGKGFLSCRLVGRVGWSAPAAIRVEGGSVGFQIGGSETDVVMLVMNESGAKKLLDSQFTLGGEGSVAAGPVGRTATADTDAFMRAEILSWSRARGVFAGISLQGATLRQDMEENQTLYGKRLTTEEVVHKSTPPAAAARLMALLTRFSPREKSGD